MRRGGVGLGAGALRRRDQGRGQRRARLAPAALRRRGAPGPPLRRRRTASDGRRSQDGGRRRRRRTTGAAPDAAAGRADGGGAGRPRRAPPPPATTGSGRPGAPTGTRTSGAYRRTADFRVSTTDPDASPMPPADGRHAPGLPRPLRRRRRQGADHPDRPGDAGRGAGEPAGARPALAGPLPLEAPARGR